MNPRATLILAVMPVVALGVAGALLGGRSGARTIEVRCDAGWSSTTNDLSEVAPSPWHTEEDALLAYGNSLNLPLPATARRITTDPSADGFLETARSSEDATFVLLRAGAPVAELRVTSVEAGGFEVTGAYACT